jgi:hypothetical protein
VKKSHKLTFFEEYDFKLIGITSHENDYHLCWKINQILDLRLVRLEDLHIFNSKFKISQDYSLYHYSNEDSMAEYHLISNRCENGFLLEELRNIDFLLKISGDMDEQFLNNLLGSLRTIEGVTAAFELDPSQLKSREKLIF